MISGRVYNGGNRSYQRPIEAMLYEHAIACRPGQA